MNRQCRNALDSFQRVQEFIKQHPLPDAAAVLGVQVAALDDAVAKLTSNTVTQESGKRYVQVHVESQRKLRAALYTDHMQPISRVAREIFGLTGMDRAFRLPKNTGINSPLLTAARAMLDAAEKQKDAFVRHGMPDDFTEQLRASVEALEGAKSAKTESARRRTTATAAVEDQVKRGRKAVRLLNAILQPKLKKDPDLLAAWESARKVRTASPAEVVAPTPQIAPVKAA